MVTLVAEDLLLLLLDDDKGTMVASSHEHAALGGAVLTELAVTGAVSVEDKNGFWATRKVRVEPGAVAQNLVGRLGKGSRRR